MKSGQKLGDAYLNANLSVVRQRLYRGADGWRWCALTRCMKNEHGLMPANLQIETSLRWSRSARHQSEGTTEAQGADVVSAESLKRRS
jgi:hypothetical protein